MTPRVIDKAAFFQKIGYSPFAEQRKFHASKARFRIACCGRRFGKSEMAAKDLEPKLFLPNKRYWCVAPTYDLGEKEFRVIWLDLIVNQRLGQDKRVLKAYNKKQGNMFIQFPWNTRLEVRSADHPENLVGDSLDHVIMSEAAKHKEETWQRYIRPALADRHGGADFPTTPEGYNWLYDMFMLGQDNTIPAYESWKFPSWQNPYVYPLGYDDPEIKLLQRTMTPEAFAQEIGADFGSFVGKIYPEWDAGIHVRNVEFRPDWPNYIAFDFGYNNPFAAIEFQISPSDEIFIWREHYRSYERVETHCKILREREQPPGYHLDLGFGDAADPEAVQTISELLIQTYALPEAKENWRDGVDLVRKFMSRNVGDDEYGTPIYQPALFVDFSCVNTIREFNNYRAPGSVQGRNVKEIGFNQDDHALDAIRYALVHIYRLGCVHHLSEVMEFTDPSSTGLIVPDYIPTSFFDASDSGFFTQGGEF